MCVYIQYVVIKELQILTKIICIFLLTGTHYFISSNVHHLFVFSQINGNAIGIFFPDIIMNVNEQINHISPLILNILPPDLLKCFKFFCCLANSTYSLKYLPKARGISAKHINLLARRCSGSPQALRLCRLEAVNQHIKSTWHLSWYIESLARQNHLSWIY